MDKINLEIVPNKFAISETMLYLCTINWNKDTKKMEKTIADKIREQNESVYKVVSRQFGVTYKYVWLIARCERSGSRGKGKLIKDYLEQQIKN